MRCLSLILLLVLASTYQASAQVRPPTLTHHKRSLQQAPPPTGQPAQTVALPVIPVSAPVQQPTAPASTPPPVTQVPPEVTNAVNAAVQAAVAAQTAAAAALAAAQAAQQAVTNAANQQQSQPTSTTTPTQPIAPSTMSGPAPEVEAGLPPVITTPEVPPVAATGTFAAPGVAPLAEPLGIAGANQTEIAVNAGSTGVPVQTIPGGLPSRLTESLAAQQPLQG